MKARGLALGLAAALLCVLLAGCGGLLDMVLADGDKQLPPKPSVVYDPLVEEDFAPYDGFRRKALCWDWVEDTTNLRTIRGLEIGSTTDQLMQSYGANACSFNGGWQAEPLVDCWYDAGCPDSFTVYFVLFVGMGSADTLSLDSYDEILEKRDGKPLKDEWGDVLSYSPYRMTITVEGGSVTGIASSEGLGG